MSGPCGKWLTRDEYARAAGLDEGAAGELVRKAGLMVKTIAGRSYVWVDDPERVFDPEAEAAPAAAKDPVPDAPRCPDPAPAPVPESEPEPVEGDAMLARFSGVSQLALQTERAISLVERSLNTFVMMHREVVAEKDRYADLHREGLGERDRLIEDGKRRVAELEGRLRDQDQEIADLRMLVEILEGRKERTRTEAAPLAGLEEKASVGDLMEEQLRYIMEDQMIRNLLDE